jgi:hypothetical protein
VELYIHYSIRLLGVVLNHAIRLQVWYLVKHSDNFTFTLHHKKGTAKLSKCNVQWPSIKTREPSYTSRGNRVEAPQRRHFPLLCISPFLMPYLQQSLPSSVPLNRVRQDNCTTNRKLIPKPFNVSLLALSFVQKILKLCPEIMYSVGE